jgi:4'-phosphopantetheinyl transferase
LLNSGEILVVRADLDRVPVGALPPLLPDEAARADRFRSEEVRSRFIASHGVLRSILAGIGVQAVYQRDTNGKPRLVGSDQVHFNMSRSQGSALYAFALDVPVGADIDRVRPVPEYMEIGERFLPPTRYAELLETPPEARLNEFFRQWTHLEASLKALGVGLYGAGSELEGPWTLEDVEAGDGVYAAVAAPADGMRVVVRDFSV